MTSITEHYADAARRLLTDDILAEAMTEVRTEALVKLALVKADDTLEILRLQAIAGCLSDVRAWLEAKILATGEKDGGVSATTKPTE